MEKVGGRGGAEKNMVMGEGDTSWDMSEFLEGATEQMEELTIEQELERWSNEYRTTERQFAKYAKGFAGSEKDESYRKSLLKYEDDLAHDYKLLEEATQEAWDERVIRSSYEWAQKQNMDAVEPGETIEAATGIFFDERMKAIYQGINANVDEKAQAEDRAFARQTWQKVLGYIEAANDYELLHMNYEGYQRGRQGAHNAMIRQLNGLNEMAEKYGCQRLTIRNFMANDFSYNAKMDSGRSLDRRANYDRETVLGYFRTVYSSEFMRAEYKSSREIVR